MADAISTCVVCGAQFHYQRANRGRPRIICSDACKAERRLLQVPKAAHRCRCIRCEASFTASKPNAIYCSQACRQSIRRQRKKARGWKRPPQRAYWALKRARKLTATVEAVDPNAVFERDGWRCHLCGCKTRPKDRGTTRSRAPELDHIVPLSQGGDHSYQNTACSCRRCNLRKGAKLVGQLRLFG